MGDYYKLCPACKSTLVANRETIGDIFTGEVIWECVNDDCPGEELRDEQH